MQKKWHNYIIYLSLFFLVVALYRADILEFPAIDSPFQLIVAFFLLGGGFVSNALAQRRLLQKSGLPVSVRQAFAMTGLNIFGKYIPGKVWMVVGSAVYLQAERGYPLADLSLLFLRAQLITIWCGLMLGICGLFWNNALDLLSWAGLLFFSFFSAAIFSTTMHQAGQKLINRIFSKAYALPVLTMSKTLALIPWFVMPWLFWGGGFFMLASSMYVRTVPISGIFCFPLAGTLGVLFLLAPGGLGVREGVITGYLVLLEISLPEAIGIATASRLWFLAGEVFIFALGYAAAHWPRRLSATD